MSSLYDASSRSEKPIPKKAECKVRSEILVFAPSTFDALSVHVQPLLSLIIIIECLYGSLADLLRFLIVSHQLCALVATMR